MYCKKCGAIIPEGGAFCPKCGQRQTFPISAENKVMGDAAAPTQRKERSNSVLKGIGALILVLVVVASITYEITVLMTTGYGIKLNDISFNLPYKNAQLKKDGFILCDKEMDSKEGWVTWKKYPEDFDPAFELIFDHAIEEFKVSWDSLLYDDFKEAILLNESILAKYNEFSQRDWYGWYGFFSSESGATAFSNRELCFYGVIYVINDKKQLAYSILINDEMDVTLRGNSILKVDDIRKVAESIR